ncbi:MAG: DoxX family protein [Planctomycetes bacterium]|nr:DoxX family protein [Planctomycetota bacterium]
MGKPNLSGSDAGMLILRLALGGIFVAHGVAKLLPWGEGLETFSKTVGGLGIPGPAYPAAVAIVAAEILGGLMVVLGLFARVGALALAAVMAGAIYFVHLHSGFFLKVMVTPQDITAWPADAAGNKFIPHGIEFNVALLAMSLQVVLGGAGKMVLAARSKKGGAKGG